MGYPYYELSANHDFTVFEFVSTGAKGAIRKAVKYTLTRNQNVYNMGFGDIISGNEAGVTEIDDRSITDNGDLAKVLATVARSVYAFTEKYPGAYVLFGSSNPAKRRLFRMALARRLKEIARTFAIFGAVRNAGGQLVNVPYEPMANTDGYFIRRIV